MVATEGKEWGREDDDDEDEEEKEERQRRRNKNQEVSPTSPSDRSPANSLRLLLSTLGGKYITFKSFWPSS